MVKARLGKTTEKWIAGKTEKRNDVKTAKQNDPSKKSKLTIYLSEDAVKMLWHNRAETGKPISHTVEQLVMKQLGKNEKKE